MRAVGLLRGVRQLKLSKTFGWTGQCEYQEVFSLEDAKIENLLVGWKLGRHWGGGRGGVVSISQEGWGREVGGG